MSTYDQALVWKKQQLQLNRNDGEMYNKHQVAFHWESGFVNVLSCKTKAIEG